jgi:hypothetical protein
LFFSFQLTAIDQAGHTVTSYSGTVHFSSSDGQAVLPANTTLSNGVGTFAATLKTAGSQSLTATDTANPSSAGTSGPLGVSPAAASTFTFALPTTIAKGTPFNFQVTARDPFGNVATGYAGTVILTSSSLAFGLLPSTLTNGVGDFGATLGTLGNQTITATDKANSAITGTSNPILVS